MAYTAIRRVRVGDQVFRPGDSLDITSETLAQRLIASGAVGSSGGGGFTPAELLNLGIGYGDLVIPTGTHALNQSVDPLDGWWWDDEGLAAFTTNTDLADDFTEVEFLESGLYVVSLAFGTNTDIAAATGSLKMQFATIEGGATITDSWQQTADALQAFNGHYTQNALVPIIAGTKYHVSIQNTLGLTITLNGSTSLSATLIR